MILVWRCFGSLKQVGIEHRQVLWRKTEVWRLGHSWAEICRRTDYLRQARKTRAARMACACRSSARARHARCTSSCAFNTREAVLTLHGMRAQYSARMVRACSAPGLAPKASRSYARVPVRMVSAWCAPDSVRVDYIVNVI